MIKKIKTIYDLYMACRHMPDFMENPLDDLKALLDDKTYENGWYWDDEKKELFSPLIVLSDPSYDLIYIMKESMTEDDCYPQMKYVDFMFGQTFYLDGHPDYTKEKIFNDYIFDNGWAKR